MVKRHATRRWQFDGHIDVAATWQMLMTWRLQPFLGVYTATLTSGFDFQHGLPISVLALNVVELRA